MFLSNGNLNNGMILLKLTVGELLELDFDSTWCCSLHFSLIPSIVADDVKYLPVIGFLTRVIVFF